MPAADESTVRDVAGTTGRAAKPRRCSKPRATLALEQGGVQPGGDQVRHAALMRMLATIRDRIEGVVTTRSLYRAAALVVVGLRRDLRDLDHGQLAREAAELGDALLEVASDEPPIGEPAPEPRDGEALG